MLDIVNLLLGPVGAIVGALVVVVGAYLKGRSAGSEKERSKQLKDTADAYKNRAEVENSVSGASDAERDRMRKQFQRD